jgi:beta-glucanase (GH16 family)
VLRPRAFNRRLASWLLAGAVAVPWGPGSPAPSEATAGRPQYVVSSRLVELGPGHYAVRGTAKGRAVPGRPRPRLSGIGVALERRSCDRCDWGVVAQTVTGRVGRYRFRIDAPSRRPASYRIQSPRSRTRAPGERREFWVEPMAMNGDGDLPYWGRPTWRDEFDGSAVDADKWRVLDDTYVSYDEASIYREQAAVRDGKLILTANRVDPALDQFGRSWATAYLDTRGDRFSQRYGRFEILSRIPTRTRHSSGLWPSFWLRDETGPGEIDVMEAWGTPSARPGEEDPGNTTWTVHSDTMGGGKKVGGWAQHREAPSVARGFYKYAVEWTPAGIEVFVNDRSVGAVSRDDHPWLDSSFPSAANLRLQLAVGSEYWGSATDATETPAGYAVEYVRVWEYPGTPDPS